MLKRLLTSFAVLAVLAATMVATQAASASSTTRSGPFDYSKITGLSEPVFKKVVEEKHMLRMKDGVEVYVEITRPKTTRKVPVVAEISPYHGTIYDRDGVRMLPEQGGFLDYLWTRGYAVLMMDVRGTGRSGGCLDLMGPRDQSDAKAVIEWAASRPWSSGRVGILGHSYPGGTSVMSLAQHPKGLVTAVVSAGLGSMYEHQFQGGVPFFFQWAGPYIGYSALTFERHMPIGLVGLGSGRGGDDFGNNTQYAACGLNSAPALEGAGQLTALDQLSGRYSQWHARRDFRAGAASSKAPVFVIHGVNDNAARITSLDWFLRRNNARDKLWLGQWDHGSGCCPNRRGWQWTNALHAWFDKHLLLRDVDTGPSFEAFLADSSFDSATQGARSQIMEAPRFDEPSRMLKLSPDAGGGLSTSRRSSGSVSFAGSPLGAFGNALTDGATFTSAPVKRDTVLVGMPRLRLAVSVTVPRVYVIGTVFDESPAGELRRITQFSINPELRETVRKAQVVIPGKKYLMGPPGFAMAHNLRKGHRLVLRVTTSDPDKVPYFSVDPNVTVFTGAGDTQLELPVVDRPTLFKDTVQVKPPKNS